MLKKILAIVGSFWATIWRDTSVFGVVYALYRLIAGSIRARLQRSYNSVWYSDVQSMHLYTPTKVYVPCAALHKQYADLQVQPADSVIPGRHVSEQKYLLQGNFPQLQQSLYICNKIYKPQSVLVNGCSYIPYKDYILIVDLSAAGFSTQIVLYEGQLRPCFCLYVYSAKKQQMPDTIPDIIKPLLPHTLDKQGLRYAWQAYVKGPTIGVIKQLIGHILNSPVAQNQELVLDIRKQRELWAVSTDKHIYLSPYQPIVTVGQNLQKYQRIFCGSYVISGNQSLPQQQSLPGLLVPTSVGSLFAPNKQQQDNSILQLTGPADTVAAYRSAVDVASKDPNRPIVHIPAQLNTMQFVLKDLQRSQYLIIMLCSDAFDSGIHKLLDFIQYVTNKGIIIYTSSSVAQQQQVSLTYTASASIVQVTT